MHNFTIKTNDHITKVNLKLKTECEYTTDRAISDWKNGFKNTHHKQALLLKI